VSRRAVWIGYNALQHLDATDGEIGSAEWRRTASRKWSAPRFPQESDGERVEQG